MLFRNGTLHGNDCFNHPVKYAHSEGDMLIILPKNSTGILFIEPSDLFTLTTSNNTINESKKVTFHSIKYLNGKNYYQFKIDPSTPPSIILPSQFHAQISTINQKLGVIVKPIQEHYFSLSTTRQILSRNVTLLLAHPLPSTPLSGLLIWKKNVENQFIYGFRK